MIIFFLPSDVCHLLILIYYNIKIYIYIYIYMYIESGLKFVV